MVSENLLPQNNIHRRIIHLDMDAFYASVEMRDHPELANKAVVVAHDPRKHGGHGVITTANYLARQYGVGSAMPAIEAVRKVPKDLLVFIDPNFEKYRTTSAQVHEIMHRVTDIIEPISLDEAYLDVTKNKLGNYSAIQLASYLQQQVYQTTHLTSSFGVSYNKFLAKIGSDYAKPFGRTVILPGDAMEFLAQLDIGTFPGIGKKTKPVMQAMGINTGKDLQEKSVEWLIDHFQRQGYVIAMHSRGIDLSPVVASRQRKSIGKERTFEPSLHDEQAALSFLRQISRQLADSLAKRHLTAGCVVLKIRDRNFQTITRRSLLKGPTQEAEAIFAEGRELLMHVPEFLAAGTRLLGLSVTNLQAINYEEIDLFDTDLGG